MNQDKNRDEAKRKHSTFNPSPELLQTLKDIFNKRYGTVTYVFCTPRVDLSNRKKYPEGRVYTHESKICAPINPASFYKDIKGKVIPKTPQEFLQMFKDTKEDLCATYFVIE